MVVGGGEGACMHMSNCFCLCVASVIVKRPELLHYVEMGHYTHFLSHLHHHHQYQHHPVVVAVVMATIITAKVTDPMQPVARSPSDRRPC